MRVQSGRLIFIITALIVLLGLVWLIKVGSQPRQFNLLIINQSGMMVDQVRLFGTALEQDAILLNLEPQQAVELQTAIAASGALRVEISQGLNRIDSHIVEDTRTLDALSQRLTIEPGNRFLLGTNE